MKGLAMNSQVKTQETQSTKPFVATLAVPVLPSNTPAMVPSDKPNPGAVVVEAFYQPAAHEAAIRIMQAETGRLEAFKMLAKVAPNMAALKGIRTALKTELQLLGSARADSEATDWYAFALAYHAEPQRVEEIISPDYREIKRDGNGEPVKDSLGNPVKVRLTGNNLAKRIRAIRDTAARANKIPKDIFEPQAGTTPSADDGVGAQQLKAFESYCNKAKPDQFMLMAGYLLHAAKHQPNGDVILSNIRKAVNAAAADWAAAHPKASTEVAAQEGKKKARKLVAKGEAPAAEKK